MSIGARIRKRFHRTTRRLGFKVTAVGRPEADTECQVALMAQHGVDLILGAGANHGQFAQLTLAAGYPRRIVSFEPLSGSYAALEKASAGHPRWQLAVQGYEEEVLAGAPEFLGNAAGLLVELCLVPLYDGQMLFRPLIERLADLGFELDYLSPAAKESATGRWLADGFFFREPGSGG